VTLTLAADEVTMPAPVAPSAVSVAPAESAVDELVERVRPWATGAVDPLQIAAALESEGVTDRLAVARYGRADVFDLAETVHRRVAGAAPLPPEPGRVNRPGRVAEPPRRRTWRDLSHGLLYLLPSAAFPAAVTLVGHSSLVLVVVLAGALGWVWSSVTAWVAFQYLGARRPAAAARRLRWSTLAALPAAGLAGLAVTAVIDGGPAPVVLAVGMMAYQMGSTVLIFYRGELWLGLLMLPAVTGGVAYFIVGAGLIRWAIAAAALSIVAAFALALWHTVSAVRRAEGRGSAAAAIRLPWATVVLVTAYSAMAAAFLLHAQAPYLLTHLDIVLAVGPLLAGMGVVEWRARRYVERAPALLNQVVEPWQFDRGMRLRLVAETLGCMAAVATFALPLLVGLAALGRLGPATIAMAAACAALGGAYFLGFVLAGQGRFATLAVILAAATGVHLVVASVLPATPLADILAFLGGAVLLEVVELTLLAGTVGQAWRYRINQGDECTP
jgi:hypothetical protein